MLPCSGSKVSTPCRRVHGRRAQHGEAAIMIGGQHRVAVIMMGANAVLPCS
jgi:hypothetical protein